MDTSCGEHWAFHSWADGVVPRDAIAGRIEDNVSGDGGRGAGEENDSFGNFIVTWLAGLLAGVAVLAGGESRRRLGVIDEKNCWDVWGI